MSQTSNATLTSLVDDLLNISCIFINFTLNVPMPFYQQMKVIFFMK